MTTFRLLLVAQVATILVGTITASPLVIVLAGVGLILALRSGHMPARRPEPSGDQEIAVAIEEVVNKRTEHLVEMVQKYEQAALTDALTGLLNRRGGEEAIVRNLARSRRVKTALSFLLVDLDHFKRVNDEHGHATGDLVLCSVTATITMNLRIADQAIRWGGEEILLCLPDTDLEGAIQVAHKLRNVIASISFDNGLKVTASFGAAEVSATEEFHTALARADMNLYIAKAGGRNAVFPASLDHRPSSKTE
jgi:diguanylate cyclase (GGDEF)-like protein